jgi:hypothetical protein
MLSTNDIIRAAMSVAREVTSGALQPAEIEAATLAKCREAVGVVYGPHDPLWELHRDISRQFLHAGGHSVEELLEWVAVMRSRQEPAVEERGVSWIEQALADGVDDEGDTDDASMLGQCRCGQPNCGGEHELPV